MFKFPLFISTSGCHLECSTDSEKESGTQAYQTAISFNFIQSGPSDLATAVLLHSWIFPNCNISPYSIISRPFWSFWRSSCEAQLSQSVSAGNTGSYHLIGARSEVGPAKLVRPDEITPAWTHSRNSLVLPVPGDGPFLCLFFRSPRSIPKKCRYVALVLIRGTAYHFSAFLLVSNPPCCPK